MLNKINLRSNLLVFGIPLLMILSLIITVKSSFFVPKLSVYIIADFLITIPLIYFLLVRKSVVSNKTIITVVFLGLVIASIILPKENQELISKIKMLLIPIAEIAIVVYITIVGKKAINKAKEKKDYSLDFFDIVDSACAEVLPAGIASVLATEISVLYYALISWKKKKLTTNEFSYHKDGTAISIILGFLLVVGVEIFVTHSMVENGNNSGGLILAILSGYTILQIIAVLKSLSRRPIFVNKSKKELVLKFGILSKAIIPFSEIENVELTSKELLEKSETKYFSPLGSSSGHNVVIYFNKKIKYNFMYGFKKEAFSLAVFIDEKNEFVELLKDNISKN